MQTVKKGIRRIAALSGGPDYNPADAPFSQFSEADAKAFLARNGDAIRAITEEVTELDKKWANCRSMANKSDFVYFSTGVHRVQFSLKRLTHLTSLLRKALDAELEHQAPFHTSRDFDLQKALDAELDRLTKRRH